MGACDATLYNWKANHGGKDVREANRVKGLKDENARLKRLLADTCRFALTFTAQWCLTLRHPQSSASAPLCRIRTNAQNSNPQSRLRQVRVAGYVSGPF